MDADSLNSSEMERQLNEELANMEFDPEKDDIRDDEYDILNDDLGKSHTSFKSIMSGATVMTQN